jgi:hypothetical protein
LCQETNAPTNRDSSTEPSDESNDEELYRFFLEDDDSEFMHGMLLYAMHLDKYCNRAEYRQPLMTGLEWVERKLTDRKSYYDMFRMSPTVFHRHHDLLVESYGLKSSTKSTLIEALGMFLWMIGVPQLVRQAEDIFERSLGAVHNMFEKVLESVVKLAANIIKPLDPQFSTIHPRLTNPRFHPFLRQLCRSNRWHSHTLCGAK